MIIFQDNFERKYLGCELDARKCAKSINSIILRKKVTNGVREKLSSFAFG